MPNIFITIPRNAFPGDARVKLTQRICDAAMEAEQLPDSANARAFCWISVHEADAGALTCGAQDAAASLLPCIALIHVPAGVLDEAARARYVQLVHAAFQQSLPEREKRRCITSVIVHEVSDGHWSVNGQLWKLPDFAKAAGYTHLQHLARRHAVT